MKRKVPRAGIPCPGVSTTALAAFGRYAMVERVATLIGVSVAAAAMAAAIAVGPDAREVMAGRRPRLDAKIPRPVRARSNMNLRTGSVSSKARGGSVSERISHGSTRSNTGRRERCKHGGLPCAVPLTRGAVVSGTARVIRGNLIHYPKAGDVVSDKEFRELFRYRKGDELRIYKLRVIPDGAALWRTTEKAGQPAISFQDDDFASVDEAIRTLEELEQRLKAGGWRRE